MTMNSLKHISPPLQRWAVRITTLRPEKNNARLHDERNLEAIAESLRRFGQQAPIVTVRRHKRRVVIKGNGVLRAARQLGWSHVAAVASRLRGKAVTAYALADNRTGELSTWDQELLAAQLYDLQSGDDAMDLLSLGFTDEDIALLRDQADKRPPGMQTRRRPLSAIFTPIVRRPSLGYCWESRPSAFMRFRNLWRPSTRSPDLSFARA